MDTASLRKLLQEVRSGTVSPDDAVARLRHMPFEDLGFAKIDHHRRVRSGMPEVIFGQGKTPAQVAGIFARLAELACVEPAQVLHIGDDPLTDVVGATRAGMQAVWLNRDAREWPRSAGIRPRTISTLAEIM